ncbi:hypothetical protein [Paenibacillus artemisiicola]|nr:hypothetical protein [Paenibacillus artemisiicola]
MKETEHLVHGFDIRPPGGAREAGHAGDGRSAAAGERGGMAR